MEVITIISIIIAVLIGFIIGFTVALTVCSKNDFAYNKGYAIGYIKAKKECENKKTIESIKYKTRY